MFFSPSKLAFFSAAHTDDCVEVSDDLFNELHEHMLKGGGVVARSDGLPMMVPLPPPPEPDWYAEAYRRVDQWRAKQEQGTVLLDGVLFDADRAARDRISNVLLAGANPLGIWTDAANVDQPMDIERLRRLHLAIVAQGGRIHARQREMKAALANMAPAQLKAFTPDW